MKLIDKLLFLKKAYNLSDKEFAKRFNINPKQFINWITNNVEPTKSELVYLANEINVDIDDFMNPTSTIDKNYMHKNEHFCKVNNQKLNIDDVIDEDYPKEDNPRFEEKD